MPHTIPHGRDISVKTDHVAVFPQGEKKFNKYINKTIWLTGTMKFIVLNDVTEN